MGWYYVKGNEGVDELFEWMSVKPFPCQSSNMSTLAHLHNQETGCSGFFASLFSQFLAC